MSKADDDVYYGIIPLLPKDKIYGFWDIFLITSGFAIATWCYVQGGYVATLLGIKAVILNVFFSMTLAGMFVMLAAIISTRHGIDLWVYQRAIYGHIGVNAFLIPLFIIDWGWYAVNAQTFGASMSKLIGAAGMSVSDGAVPWISVIAVVIGWIIAIKGPVAVKRSTYVMVPSLFLVGILILIMVFSKYSFSDLAAMKPVNANAYGTQWETYMIVLEWNIAFVLAWFPVLGSLPRLVKTERSSYWGTVAGFGIIMAAFVSIGAITGLVMSQSGQMSNDPTDWLISLGGAKLGLISLFLVGVANVTTAAAGAYSLAISTKILNPKWDYRVVVTVWSVWCALLTLWGGVWTYYTVFLAVMGAACGPAIGLIIADYFIVRKSKVSMDGLFQVRKSNVYTYTKGFNIVGLIALVIGIVGYFLLYDPINYAARNFLFNYTTASGLSTALSMVVYVVLSKIPSLKSYLLQDQSASVQVSKHQATL